jgi:hypothetical protein
VPFNTARRVGVPIGSLLEAPGSQAAEGFVTGSEQQVPLNATMSTSYSCGRRGKVVTAEIASMIPAASSVSRGSHGFLPSSCRALDGHRSIARNLRLPWVASRTTPNGFCKKHRLADCGTRSRQCRPWCGPVAHTGRGRRSWPLARGWGVSTHACASPAPWPVSPRSRYYWAD